MIQVISQVFSNEMKKLYHKLSFP